MTDNETTEGWGWGSLLLAGAIVVNAAMSEDQSRKIEGDSDSEGNGY